MATSVVCIHCTNCTKRSAAHNAITLVSFALLLSLLHCRSTQYTHWRNRREEKEKKAHNIYIHTPTLSHTDGPKKNKYIQLLAAITAKKSCQETKLFFI